ncbi:unnamed protein product [Rhizophagus irregularis]|nr:unnamed protein product [Rhizophagus irregularis]CAB5366698.1 unnamed protein product [Rhizophagus irregularis]
MQHESLSAFTPLFPVADDNVACQGDRAVKSRKEITWDVINQLIIAFDNPIDNSLFKDILGLSNMTAEHTSEGWAKLFNCYSLGEEHINAILKQDVLKSEKRVAVGRRAKNIGHHTIANMKKSNNNTRGRDLVENPRPTKRIKRTTHTQELSFLEPLVNNTSEENINNAIQQLNNWNIANNHPKNLWNRQRVIKWVQTRTHNDKLARERQEPNN